MPVVELSLPRFAKMVGASRATILQRLPYVGLDIESSVGNLVRVEYSPNRPDLGTDFGIARALRGLLGKEVGLPEFKTFDSGITVSVDKRLGRIRPYIACATAIGLHLNDEDVRQIISLQEDLHNGLGRRRKVVAIGLHDLRAVKPPVSYSAVPPTFRFVPLGSSKTSTIRTILSGTKEGQAYGQVLEGSNLYPIISDSAGAVLSFPPVINGDKTKVTTRTREIFIDVTSTDMKAGDDVLAILTTTLAEAGARIGTISIEYARRHRVTPDLSPTELPIDIRMIRSVLGLDLTVSQVSDSLRRSRLSVRGKKALAARYRVDLLHPVDLAEEVALGYGVDRIGPLYPPSKQPGSFHPFEQFMDSTSTIMAGAGMLELMTYELTDEKSLYANFGRTSIAKVVVHEPRSIEHSALRDSLIPTLMAALSSNVKSDYPQRVFEIGRVYMRTERGVDEAWHLGCLTAHSQASFSEAKSYAESVCRTLTGEEMAAAESRHWAYSDGRVASLRFGSHVVGHVGELKPASIAAFGLNVPVSGFELDLSALYERLK